MPEGFTATAAIFFCSFFYNFPTSLCSLFWNALDLRKLSNQKITHTILSASKVLFGVYRGRILPGSLLEKMIFLVLKKEKHKEMLRQRVCFFRAFSAVTVGERRRNLNLKFIFRGSY